MYRVSRLRQIAEEVFGRVRPYPSFAYKAVIWESNSQALIIEYLEGGFYNIRVFRYHYFARITGAHAHASSVLDETHIVIESHHSKIDVSFPQVLDIFTSEDAITDFLYSIRDNGIGAFVKLLSDNVSKFTV